MKAIPKSLKLKGKVCTGVFVPMDPALPTVVTSCSGVKTSPAATQLVAMGTSALSAEGCWEVAGEGLDIG